MFFFLCSDFEPDSVSLIGSHNNFRDKVESFLLMTDLLWGVAWTVDCGLLMLSVYLATAAVITWSFVPLFLKLMIKLSSQADMIF
ncbi:hypothetical protein Leryth_018743 [Lithospermum erythrorhizon]|nr:hypothetical protein Leryth_018743 [Lithospermum erythrorhizon]